jgi:hypothetical protein
LRSFFAASAPRWISTRSQDVFIAKLEWMKISPSERQVQDAAGILTVQRDRLDWPYIEKWVAELQLQQQLDQALRATLP